MSVTRLNSGTYNGKYMLVQSIGWSGQLKYTIADTPYGFAGKPDVLFYTTTEQYTIPGAYTYNAKAHPHLSPAGNLLVSYNVNIADFPTTNDIYRPRFVKLSLNGLN